MLLSADIIANAASCGLLLLIISKFCGFLIKNRFIRLILLVVLVRVFYVVPVYHTFTLVEITRGIVGDLSISGLFMMMALGITYFAGQKNKVQVFPKSVCIFLIIAGIALYVSTLGFIKFDLYSFGFYPRPAILIGMFIIELLMWYFSRVFALIWLFALLAFYLKLQLSSNLWDYLLDPVLWLLSIDHLLLGSGSSAQSDSDDAIRRDHQEEMVVHNSIQTAN